ncbi:MAG TPA: hypothetical protein VE959_01700 [Bryobacteraceae bacterium]|nr:hypothetical protein [Bryobacteraceae bacterium]
MAKSSPVLFHEEQAFRQWHTALVLAMPPAALLFVTTRQLVWHHPWGTPPVSNGGLLFLSVLLVSVYVRLMTVRLVTDLRPTEIAVGLRGLWRQRRISLDQVRTVKTIEYDPIRDFGGYGIRSGPWGQAYTARGTGGVELELQNGRKVLIGSQDPKRLAGQIKACRPGAPS